MNDARADVAQQEIRHAETAVAGVDAARGDLPLQRLRIQKVIARVPVFISELEAVIALQPTQSIEQLPHLRDLSLRPPRRGAQPLQPADVDRRNAGVVRACGNAGQSELSTQRCAELQARSDRCARNRG